MSTWIQELPTLRLACQTLHIGSIQPSITRRVRTGDRRARGSSLFHRMKSSSPHQADFNVFRSVADIRQYVKGRRAQRPGHTFGLVPTMGALHQGHLALATAAAKENDEVVVSIYVNPTQFGVKEDLSSYPRTFDSDLQKLAKLREALEDSGEAHGNISCIFAPTTQEIYPTLPPTSEPEGHGSFVTIAPMGSLLEGATRPVFFRGVATVCMKLFNIVSADRVYFGQKDGQQAALIKRMVQDFHLDTEVRVLPTTREADGLAMSSRNVYLGTRRRQAAIILPHRLQAIANKYVQYGECDRHKLLKDFPNCDPDQDHSRIIEPYGPVSFRMDYVSLADLDTMQEIDKVDKSKGAILSAAMIMFPLENSQPNENLGESGGAQRNVRLIDNIILPRQP